MLYKHRNKREESQWIDPGKLHSGATNLNYVTFVDCHRCSSAGTGDTPSMASAENSPEVKALLEKVYSMVNRVFGRPPTIIHSVGNLEGASAVEKVDARTPQEVLSGQKRGVYYCEDN